ncbi:MAG: hypothetical protein QOI24_3464 [Acidobacteriota bacterium]|jgi:rRNA maturation protein Nop10|nr:hypothetical protein [Acidobacteriota bacterium]
MEMRKPFVSKPRSASAAFTLSRRLPPLRLPAGSVSGSGARPKPQVGRPGRAIFGALSSAPGGAPASTANPTPYPGEDQCQRCGHDEELHPVRYVCDKYPHPDPLQICGCESETLDELCHHCGHKARWHKPRHRCKAAACNCWGFDGDKE